MVGSRAQAESERDAARLQLGRAEEHAEHLAAKLKDQSDHLERLRADYARTSAALQKQKVPMSQTTDAPARMSRHRPPRHPRTPHARDSAQQHRVDLCQDERWA